MGEMIKMAREMQGQLKKVKDELSREIFTVTAHGITVKISGDMEIKELKIEPKEVDPNNVGRLEKNIRETTAKALKEAKDGAAQKMKGVTGGMGLPNIPGLF
jgi:hypothetical protein